MKGKKKHNTCMNSRNDRNEYHSQMKRIIYRKDAFKRIRGKR